MLPLKITAAMTRRTQMRASDKLVERVKHLACMFDEGTLDDEELYEVFEEECLAEILRAAQHGRGAVTIAGVFENQYVYDRHAAGEVDGRFRERFAVRARDRGYSVELSESDDSMFVAWCALH
jgi:hypothetical protein